MVLKPPMGSSVLTRLVGSWPAWCRHACFSDHWNVIDEKTAENPFRLITPPSQNFLNSTFSETKTSRIKERSPEVLIHPKVMRKLGIAEGELVRIGNERGSVVLNAVTAKQQHEDTLVVEGIWPASTFLKARGSMRWCPSEPAIPITGPSFMIRLCG